MMSEVSLKRKETEMPRTLIDILAALFDCQVASLPHRRWIAVARERRRLADLPPDRLRDVGLTPGQAQAEARRPFWDLPDGR